MMWVGVQHMVTRATLATAATDAGPQLKSISPSFDHQARLFDPFGLRQFGGVCHVADNSLSLKRPVLRHQRVDEKLASARSVGCMAISKFTPQCTCYRVAYDAPMLRLPPVGIVDKIEKGLGFGCTWSNRKSAEEPAVTN
jgi:hypothetical protein